MTTADELRARLPALMLRDAARLERQLERPRDLDRLAEQVTAAEGRVERRRAAVPRISYPQALPVTQYRDELKAAIEANQVVVVAGETGSGKTTQLPKICLELGRGVRGTIGHTQPRRLAARTVAERIAEELGTPLGDTVGFSVRFTDRVSDRTLVKLMTDGILLAEVQRDRMLRGYDTIILDEAHERSLNIDFLLGYLVRLLPRRPDLKVVITSATIDPQRFADAFGGAPVVEVSGRTFPVEVRYRPVEIEDDVTDSIVGAIEELPRNGDVLVFLSGEREIRDTAEALRGRGWPGTDVLPLYARLATAEQQRVWQPHSTRRIVLATNVAETSLTVPGIKYVVDPGTARISRYSTRTKVQRLPIEPVSQASADQRKGRCGRTSDGICVRLYSEDDYAGRPRFTDPEILRTNLASVILQMAALRLGDVADFPFLDPPDRRAVRDGVALLHELGALDDAQRLTEIGRQLAQLPVDPRIARMIVQAGREGCVREVLVLAAALSIPDPRERPADQQAAADQRHARFTDENSDFVGFLNLWNHLREQQRERSGNQFRRMCREEFLHYLRVREWQDLRGQLRQIAAGIGLTETDQPASAQQVHTAVTAGLLSQVGMRAAEGREFLGARGTRFVVAPGSALAKRPPRWVVAAELVETSRLFARVVARIEPDTVERLAGHLVQRTYSEPHWDRRRGAVMAYERVTLYGVPLVTRRRVDFARIDPPVARELFLRHALVAGEWDTRHRFVRDNAALMEELRELESRSRRRDLLVGEDEVFDFYDKRVPAEVVSSRHFDSWWKRQPDKALLTMTRADLLRTDVGDDEHPDVWWSSGVELPVSYRFDPGAPDDGVTVHVPVETLARLGGDTFSWQVPALREELVTALVRSLPKELRRLFVPAPDTARRVLAGLTPGREDLLHGVQRELHRLTGVLVPLDAFDLERVPPHLRLTFSVESDGGDVLARGKDIDELRERLAAPARTAVAARFDLERTGLDGWPADLDEIPRTVHSGDVVGYPALTADRALRVFPTEREQHIAMPAGVRVLLRGVLPSPVRALTSGLSPRDRLLLGANPDGGLPQLLDDVVDATVDALVADHGLPWTRSAFAALRESTAPVLLSRSGAALADVRAVLSEVHAVRNELPAAAPPSQRAGIEDVRAQLDALLPAGFVTRAGAGRLRDLARYVRAAGRRLERLPRDPELDRALMQRVHQVQAAYDALVTALPPARAAASDVQDVRWLLEELRVSLFAQQLGTARPVSEQRVYRAIDRIAP